MSLLHVFLETREVCHFSEPSHKVVALVTRKYFNCQHFIVRASESVCPNLHSVNTTLHQHHLLTFPTRMSTTWRDRHWSDISSQLLRLNTIDETNFEASLLKKDTANGAWLWSWLVPHTIPPHHSLNL